MSLEIDRSSWRRVEFGDVVSSVNDNVKNPAAAGIERLIGLEHIDPGELAISRWGTVSEETTFTRRVRPGQTLFGKRRAYQRKTAYAEFDAVCSGDILVLASKDSDVLLPELLPFVATTDSFYAKALETSAGSLSPRTRWSDLAKFQFMLPPPVEQRRLSDLLWAMQRHSQALWEVHRRCLSASKTVLYSQLAAGTPTVPLGEIARVSNGQTFPSKMQGRPTGDVPFFKVSDLDSDGNERWLTNAANWLSDSDIDELGATPLPPGTIVTARVGAALRLERRRMTRTPCLVDDNHLVIVPREGISPVFLWAFLCGFPLSASRNDGVVPSLNQQILNSVPVPCPSFDAQDAAASAYMAILDAADKVVEERLVVTTKLLQSASSCLEVESL